MKELENRKQKASKGKSFSNIASNGSNLNQEGSRRSTTVESFCKSLDIQLKVMEQTDKDLIERVKQAEVEKQKILHQEKIDKAYRDKLA